MSLYAAKLSVHKGSMGAAQVSMIPPTWEQDSKGNHKVVKEGAVLIEIAPFLEKRGDIAFYHWEKKVSFALGIPDINIITEKSGGEFSLIHTTDFGTKTMFFKPGAGQYEGSMNILLTHKKDSEQVGQSKIAFSAGEWITFCNLLTYSVPKLLGWDEVSNLMAA